MVGAVQGKPLDFQMETHFVGLKHNGVDQHIVESGEIFDVREKALGLWEAFVEQMERGILAYGKRAGFRQMQGQSSTSSSSEQLTAP